MALGGGVFLGQSKTLPGAYVNFVSLAKAGAPPSERGTAAFALELDWGVEGEVFTVTNEDFTERSLSLFGYNYSDGKLKGLRDLFRNAGTLHAYRLGRGAKSRCDYAEARRAGARGNDLRVIIGENAEEPDLFDVKAFLGGKEVFSQTVSSAAELTDNDFIVWDKEAVLALTAGTPFHGGENGEADVSDYQAFLEKIGNYSVNAVGAVSENPAVNALFAAYAGTTRDKTGVKLQCVAFNCAADHEGVVNVKNPVLDAGESAASLVYWVTGIIAGCEVNKSNLNKAYDGEFEIFADYTQKELENAIKAGEFTLHKVGNSLRVLADINSLVTVFDGKGEAFKDNQTVRVIDRIAGDTAALFNTKYLGNVPNDESGRISLWADIVKLHEELARIRAIEDFSDGDVEVLQGDGKRAVTVKDKINVVNAMAQVYMTCVIC
ncbi:MAG: phage tail sheath family protein [Oscillospiraceae bacterium]|jgi:hypothetical protein|nr:phage tail sheath family protein [Oscillospiraceae bacterium]